MAELNVDKMAKSVAERAIQELKDNGVFVARWIPVSERLPEDSGEYLVSIIDEYDGNYEAVGVTWLKDYDTKESKWRVLGIDETVIAWMPLPEPYKEGESE